MGVAAIALTVYTLTLAPGLTFENTGTDGGDLIAAAQTLGVPHPPGYPTYTLLAWLATRVPVGPIAYRTNFLSALCAALTVGLVYLCAQRLFPPDKRSRILVAASALTFAFSPLFWSQAVITEVYTLLTLFAALFLWLFLCWRDGEHDAFLWAAGLVIGLGLGNHITLAVAAPAALVLVWPQRRRLVRARTLLPSVVLLLAGLGVYAYLPLAARQRPPVNWGNAQTWKGFLWVVTAKQYQGFAFGLAPQDVPSRISEWAELFGSQFAWVGLALALAGVWYWWKRERRFVLFCLTWMLPLGTYAFFYDTGDSYMYLLPAIMLMALWWGEGARYVLHLSRRLQPVWQQAALAVIILLPFASLALNWQKVDLSDDWVAHAYAYQMLDGIEPDSLVIVRGDQATFALWYAVYAEGKRPDVAIVSGPMLAFIWYRDHVRHLYPNLVLNEPGAEKVTWDDLVRELILDNYAQMPIYATDPKESWEAWFDFVQEDAPIYRVRLKPSQD